jgi:flagellar biogenesis protein FliO
MIMNPETINSLEALASLLAYLLVGILGLALLGAWAVKRFGPPKE